VLPGLSRRQTSPRPAHGRAGTRGAAPSGCRRSSGGFRCSVISTRRIHARGPSSSSRRAWCARLPFQSRPASCECRRRVRLRFRLRVVGIPPGSRQGFGYRHRRRARKKLPPGTSVDGKPRGCRGSCVPFARERIARSRYRRERGARDTPTGARIPLPPGDNPHSSTLRPLRKCCLPSFLQFAPAVARHTSWFVDGQHRRNQKNNHRRTTIERNLHPHLVEISVLERALERGFRQCSNWPHVSDQDDRR
jgi:hypothetical protein